MQQYNCAKKNKNKMTPYIALNEKNILNLFL